jgi:DNA mismatch endonuclease (patch repair protein)
MSRQARKDTLPEVRLRRLLHSRGLRYRIGVKVPGMARRTIDIAFTRVRVAIFVDGCFWHGCPEHASWPASNAEWWADKISANRERDLATTAHLTATNWLVTRVWEHEDPATAADRVEKMVRRRLAGSAGAQSNRADVAKRSLP